MGIKYKTVSEFSRDIFDNILNINVKDGWTPCGDLQVTFCNNSGSCSICYSIILSKNER